ncbi:hypothetical protein O8W32_01285 [Methanomassiliicoccales archaeon LGM-DZ1]|nr:hypothetical protein O8W32_01285 [Methanomassiliicoccales archaeon LGM-DZ1]
MSEITEGTWFAYQLTASRGGRSHNEPSIEKYTVAKIDGDSVTVKLEVNAVPKGELHTTKDCGSYIFSLEGLEKKGAENIKTQFGHVYANIYEFNGGGRSERIFLGKDNVVFRDVRTVMQEDGSLYTENRELCWTSMKL